MRDVGPAPVLINTITRNWSLILVRGVAAIAFGIVCFVWPAISLLALVLLWGAYALVDGAGAIVWGVRSRWWSMVVVGVVSVLAGLIAFVWPGITALALLYLIAAWAIVRGAIEIVAAIHLRRRIENEWLLALGGIASIAFGVLVAMFPAAGVFSVLWLIGAFAIVFGALAVGLSLRLRTLQRTARLQHEEVPVGAGTSTRTWDKDIR
ncbi:MAG: HdeD family acid-resistance protein [Planctomycetaceae bacterium]|nr:MAG: HdeD family acid-resistance protein [Planctomycetaceae bacterium]